MPATDTAPAGEPCWVDLFSSDITRSRDFYTRLFGWTAEEPAEEFGGYFNFRRNGVRIAGCMGNQPGSGSPDVWSVYLASSDAAKTVEASAANGGSTVVEAMQVADLGTMAVLTDPGGAGIGVWQPGTHKGFGLHSEHGAPSWFELLTRDYEAALDFYRTVFGWRTQSISDETGFRYSVLDCDGDWKAGVMDASDAPAEDVGAHWQVYFGVDDADAASKTIAELGGSVESEPEDTPYGRIAAASDPTGAAFLIVAPDQAMPAR